MEDQINFRSNNYACYAPNRGALIQCLYDMCGQVNVDTTEDKTFLSLVCICGKKFYFEKEWDIPYEDVMCSCGGHIIHYDNPIIQELILKYLSLFILVFFCSCATTKYTASSTAPVTGGFQGIAQMHESLYSWDSCWTTDTIGMTIEIKCRDMKSRWWRRTE